MFKTGTSTVFVLQGAIAESDIGVDLNGDFDTVDTITVNDTSTVSELTAGVDLNGDGDATDTVVTGINVAGIPDSPTRPVIATAPGGTITVSYVDADPAGTRTASATVKGGSSPPPAPPPPSCFGLAPTIVGTTGTDIITGTAGADIIVAGLAGNDVIDGLGGNDVICGGPGKDSIEGGAGDDKLSGGLGSDSPIRRRLATTCSSGTCTTTRFSATPVWTASSAEQGMTTC